VKKVHELKEITVVPDSIARHLTRIMRISENIDRQILHGFSSGDDPTEDPRLLTLYECESHYVQYK
jgi:hypothetical protein